LFYIPFITNTAILAQANFTGLNLAQACYIYFPPSSPFPPGVTPKRSLLPKISY